MLWVKAFHIVFVTAWFAGLFYLPRIFVNLAMEADAQAHARLLVMARKLYHFMSVMAVFALASGLYLWLHFGFRGGWIHAKLAFVVLLVGVWPQPLVELMHASVAQLLDHIIQSKVI